MSLLETEEIYFNETIERVKSSLTIEKIRIGLKPDTDQCNLIEKKSEHPDGVGLHNGYLLHYHQRYFINLHCRIMHMEVNFTLWNSSGFFPKGEGVDWFFNDCVEQAEQMEERFFLQFQKGQLDVRLFFHDPSSFNTQDAFSFMRENRKLYTWLMSISLLATDLSKNSLLSKLANGEVKHENVTKFLFKAGIEMVPVVEQILIDNSPLLFGKKAS